MSTRRSFFEDVALLSALAALARKEGYAQANDERESKFWDAYFAEASRDETRVSRGSTDGDLFDPAKKVQLIHGTKDGLRYPSGIDDGELRNDTTDVVVTANPGHFRPSPDDHKAISRSKGCQVKLEWFQKRPIMNLLAPMAWSGMAAWSAEKTTYDPKLKKYSGPTPPVGLKDLDFRDPNDPDAPLRNEIILMGGSGRMGVNVRAVRVNQRLRTVLDRTVRYSSIISPFFGFAPLAIPALKVLTDLLGAVFTHEAVIMNSMPFQILATQEAKKGPHATDGVKIVDGDFIAVPTDQTERLKSDLGKLRINQGWLVHQDDKGLPPEELAKSPRLPEVTYVSMKLTVEPLTDVIKRKSQGG